VASGASSRVAAWLAWSVAGLSFAGFAATVVLYVATRPVMPPNAYCTGGDSAVAIFVVPFLSFPLVGASVELPSPSKRRGSATFIFTNPLCRY
jgi:hypothetical protein